MEKPNPTSAKSPASIRSRADLAAFVPQLCVLKLGSAVVTTGVGKLDRAVLGDVAAFVSERLARGRATLIVSSGAVASGIGEMSLAERPKRLPELQALAAIGQSRLMAAWGDAFAAQGRHVAQILVSADDFRDRRRYLNMRYTFETLFGLGVVPIVNENDTVNVEELRFGENDGLALLVAIKMMADLLIYLTNVGGLYRAMPRAGETPERLDVVERVTPEIEALAADEKSVPGVGGMASKLRATREATRAGVPTLIAPGKEPGALGRILAGGPGGTLFLAAEGGATRLSRRQRFIAFSRLAPRGRVWVDEGAARALIAGKKSLLPAGVKRTEGAYERQMVIDVLDPAGRLIARGLTNYASDEVAAILGRKTGEIESILGRRDYDEIVHRDNLVMIGEGGEG